VVKKHPQNGPTFSKAPPKKRSPMTDAERANWQAREDAELEETKRTAARMRSFLKLLHQDPEKALQQLEQGLV
jgi:hypothetical protein